MRRAGLKGQEWEGTEGWTRKKSRVKKRGDEDSMEQSRIRIRSWVSNGQRYLPGCNTLFLENRCRAAAPMGWCIVDWFSVSPEGPVDKPRDRRGCLMLVTDRMT